MMHSTKTSLPAFGFAMRMRSVCFDRPEDGAGAPAAPAAAPNDNRPDLNALIAEAEARGAAKAREDEKKKLYSSLEREKLQRQTAQAEAEAHKKKVEEFEAAEKARQQAAMSAEERTQAAIREAQAIAEAARNEARQYREEGERRARAGELVAYRAHVLVQYGDQIVPEMVYGADEAQIDQSAANAHEWWKTNVGEKLAAYEAELAQYRQQAATPAVAAPPPSPHFVPSPYAGFPTPTHAQPVREEAVDIAQLTSEDAVRSGQYSGQVRAAIHAQLRGMQNPGQPLGTLPRHMSSPMPVQHLPGGVTAPMGTPTGPAAPPGQPQLQPRAQVQPPQGRPAPAAPPAANDPVAQAKAAVARTHAGQNPAVSGDPSARAALQQAQATGRTAQDAFNQRFS